MSWWLKRKDKTGKYFWYSVHVDLLLVIAVLTILSALIVPRFMTNDPIVALSRLKTVKNTRLCKDDVHNEKAQSVWLVAEIDRIEFDKFIKEFEFKNNFDLLKDWATAFNAPSDCEWWNISNKIDENTYFLNSSHNDSLFLAKYENGILYLKKTPFSKK